MPYIVVPRNTNIFDMFMEYPDVKAYINEKYRDHGGSKYYENLYTIFQMHPKICSLYFDHKIADSVSTFQKIYYLSPLFGCPNSLESIPFIEGCGNVGEIKTLKSEIDVYRYFNNLEKSNKDVACPPTFYKSIIYTYKGKPISDVLTINFLE
jgi:hypothetical protein